MKTSIPNISKPYLLDDFLESTNLFVRLFTNNVKGNEETISFVEPTFTGYSPINIDNSKWSVPVLNKDYATCVYSIPVVFNNLDEIYLSEPIVGYYVTNEAGDNLWYETFETIRVLDVEEGVSVHLTVNLNKPDCGQTSVVIVLDTSDPNVSLTPNDSTIQISNEFWGDVAAEGSLTDAMNRDFGSFKAIFNLILASNIFPSEDAPFTFTALFQCYGFNDLTTNLTVSKKGVNVINLSLTPLANPPPMPTATPEPDYNDADVITLYGPYDSKAGTTFGSISEDVFSFLYKINAVETPANMLIFINDLCVASVDYFGGYSGEAFSYTNGSNSFNGVFSEQARFTINGPGPTAPPTGSSTNYNNGDLVVLNGPADSDGGLIMNSAGLEKIKFNYLEDGGQTPLTTVVYLDGNLVASINYLSKYSDRAMIFVSNTGLVFNSYFNSPSINLNSQNGTPE
jgi:hypothetical protein